jgi:hypothetical protein
VPTQDKVFVGYMSNLFYTDPTRDLASIQEIKEKMIFFGCILHCYDCTSGLLWRTRKTISPEERIDSLASIWLTQCI